MFILLLEGGFILLFQVIEPSVESNLDKVICLIVSLSLCHFPLSLLVLCMKESRTHLIVAKKCEDLLSLQVLFSTFFSTFHESSSFFQFSKQNMTFCWYFGFQIHVLCIYVCVYGFIHLYVQKYVTRSHFIAVFLYQNVTNIFPLGPWHIKSQDLEQFSSVRLEFSLMDHSLNPI